MRLIVLNTKLQAELLKVKSVVALRISMMLLELIAIPEDKICLKLNKNSKTIRKIAQELIEKNIIQILKSNNQVYYVLKKKFYDIENTCRDCKFLDTNQIIGPQQEKINNYKCMKKGKTCQYKKILGAYNVTEYLTRNGTKVSIEIYNRKINKRKERETEDWVDKDFATHYIERFKSHNPLMISPRTKEVITVIKDLLAIFREVDKKNWRRLTKQYMNEFFIYCNNENKVPVPIYMINKTAISKFLKSVGVKLNKIEFCDIKNVYCSMCFNKKCGLPNGIEGCTESIVSKMKQKYN